MSTSLVISSRFNGPARSANGGYAAGSLAAAVLDGASGTVEVTLRRPPPLESPMQVRDDEQQDRVTLQDDDGLVAEARPVGDRLEDVERVPADEAAAAMLRYRGLADHPFPRCFGCGPDRAEGDGLRIFPGPVGEWSGLVASLWVPATDEDVDLPTTWAALDCVGGWSDDLAGRPAVLGRMTAAVDALPAAGEPHVVVGRHLGTEGRKSFTASTLYDADGRALARARHTWIRVDPAAFNEVG